MFPKTLRFSLSAVCLIALLIFNEVVPPAALAQSPDLFPVVLRSETAVGIGPIGVAFADFSGEGLLDMAVVHTPGEDVWFFAGNCEGGFDLVAVLPTGGINSFTIQAADFNGDNLSDFVTANWSNDTVTVFVGQGDGTFMSQTISVGITPVSVATGDLNGDGFEDIVTANGGGADTSVLFGDGTGAFTLNTIRSNIASGIIIVDLNNDGVMDLAGTNRFAPRKGLWLHFGPFRDGRQAGFLIPEFSRDLATGGTSAQDLDGLDLDDDGDIDLVLLNFSSDKLAVLLNDGKGQFGEPTTYRVQGRLPVAVEIGYFDADTHLDILVATSDGRTIEFFAGVGAGAFAESVILELPEEVAPGNSESVIAIADLDGDLFPELAVTNQLFDSVDVYAVAKVMGETIEQTSFHYPVTDRSKCNSDRQNLSLYESIVNLNIFKKIEYFLVKEKQDA